MSVEIQHGDSLRLLHEMPDVAVDAVVTDPPYSSGGLHRADRNRPALEKYPTSDSGIRQRLPGFHGDNRSERGLLLWSSLWLAEAWRVTRPGGAIAMFCDWRSLPTFSDALQAGGWVWRGVGVWTKPMSKSRPTLGGLWNDSEFILWGSRDARTSGECLPGTWTVAAPSSQSRQHPTEKPQAILQDLVRLAPEGGLVLDPFAGSGSTGIAAAIQNRSALLFEISRDYAELARLRLAALDSFGADVAKTGSTPTLFHETTP